MGTVVTLTPRRASRATTPRTSEATILLFMGVRYVRDDDPDRSAETDKVDAAPSTVQVQPLELA